MNALTGLILIASNVASIARAVLLLLKRLRRQRWIGQEASSAIWYYVVVAGTAAAAILLFKVAVSSPNSSADRLMHLTVITPAATAPVVAAFLKQ